LVPYKSAASASNGTVHLVLDQWERWTAVD
jgi:hypothetical protein